MKLFFYAKIQRKFTYLKYIKTSKASSIIEFELNFGKIKNFTESKKIDAFITFVLYVSSSYSWVRHFLTVRVFEANQIFI